MHLAYYRRLQREIDNLLRSLVHRALGIKGSRSANGVQQQEQERQRDVLRRAVSMLVRSFMPSEEDDSESEKEEGEDEVEDDDVEQED